MNIYFININARIDRKKFIQGQLKKFNLKAERISAITPEQININDYRKKYVINISLPELCCSLSHEFIWKKIITQRNKYAIIMEDDVLLSSHIKRFVNNINLVPFNFDLLRIETRLEKVQYSSPKFSLLKQFKARKIYGDVAGSAAYVISKSYCRKLLNYQNRFKKPIDHILFYKKNHGEVHGKFLQLFPALAIPLDTYDSLTQAHYSTQKITKSDIALGRLKRKSKNITIQSSPIRIYREIQRLITQIANLPQVIFYALTKRKSLLKHKIYFIQ